MKIGSVAVSKRLTDSPSSQRRRCTNARRSRTQFEGVGFPKLEQAGMKTGRMALELNPDHPNMAHFWTDVHSGKAHAAAMQEHCTGSLPDSTGRV